MVGNNPKRLVLCIPDIILPSVIYNLHNELGHPSSTAMKKSFESKYYNHIAQRMIKNSTESCLTCLLAKKYDIKKVTFGNNRSHEPDQPGKVIYIDLLPAPPTKMYNSILFIVDGYSFYITAYPCKNNAQSVRATMMAYFSALGVPTCVYSDADAILKKMGEDIKTHYNTEFVSSVPYQHHQNNAELHIKTFKKLLTARIYDSKGPVSKSEWPQLIPAVVHFINNTVMSGVGLTRSEIHFNRLNIPVLMDIEDNEFSDLTNETIKSFDRIKKLRRSKYQNKGISSKIKEGDIVVMKKGNIPVGVTSMLHSPNAGPFKVKKLETHNCLLKNIDTEEIIHSHVNMLRKLSLEDYLLILSSNWNKKLGENNIKRSASSTNLITLMKPYELELGTILDKMDKIT